MQTAYLFVYGTLRRGSAHPMQQLLASNSRYCGQAWFCGKLYELGVYPGVIPSWDPNQRVVGDLLEIFDPGLLAQLDLYEGAGTKPAQASEYLRHLVKVESAALGELNVWIYLYNWPIDRQNQILSGDYLAELEARRKN